jgi:hypothetical protein
MTQTWHSNRTEAPPAHPDTGRAPVDTDPVVVGLALGADQLPPVGRCGAAGPQLPGDRASHRTVLLLAAGAVQRLLGGGAAGVERFDPATPVAGPGGPGAAALADRPVRAPAGDRGGWCRSRCRAGGELRPRRPR